jgi:hypothetical protein
MAQLGARLVDSTARQMADQFFDRFAAQLAPATPTSMTTEPMAASDTVPTIPNAVASDGRPVTERRTATAALRPGQAKRGLGDMLAAIPRQPWGMPINFWIGSLLMLGILALLFVVG